MEWGKRERESSGKREREEVRRIDGKTRLIDCPGGCYTRAGRQKYFGSAFSGGKGMNAPSNSVANRKIGAILR